MTLRNYLTFTAPGLPDEEASLHPPAGKEYAEYIKRGLPTAGVPVEGDLQEHDSYGWAFDARVDGIRVWCMLQASDQWLLITKPALRFWNRVLGKSADAEHRATCEAIHQVLSHMPEVTDLRWYSEQEFRARQPGAESP
jgi:hypothetical protein